MKEAIRQRAFDLGFDACGVTTAAAPIAGPRFAAWLEEGRHGAMTYLSRTAAKRLDPQRVLADAQSIVVLAVSYHRPEPRRASASTAGGTANPRPAEVPRGMIARYARFADYHHVLSAPLKALADFMDRLGGPGTRSLWYVDTGPLLERDLAERAGVGFVGKHTNLIHRGLGNWFFLAEVITTLRLEPDPRAANRCGACTRCLTACPTQAIVAPFELDARRCISYLTIELRGSLPEVWRAAIGDRIFGCDDCLSVCPWNRFARAGRLMQTHAREEASALDLLALLVMDEAGFHAHFKGTPLARCGRQGLRRNVCVALGNIADEQALGPLVEVERGNDPVVAEHASWAIQQIRARGGAPKNGAPRTQRAIP